MKFTTDSGTTERQNLAELSENDTSEQNSANGNNSTYDTIMGTISGLSQANSGKTGAERAIGLGKVGYGVAKAIKWISGALL